MTRAWSGWALAACGLIALASAPVVSGAPITWISANAGQTPVFDADAGAMGEWTVNAPLSNGTALAPGATPSFVSFAPSSQPPLGTLAWSGSPLVADNSAGGLAEGQFGPGGTFSLSGKVFVGGSQVADGVLISGTLSGFGAFEPSGAENNLDTSVAPILTPTGGLLGDGSVPELADLSFAPQYELVFTLAGVEQAVTTDLVDFQNHIFMTSSFQFQMVAIPEPATAALLLGFAGLAVLRRR